MYYWTFFIKFDPNMPKTNEKMEFFNPNKCRGLLEPPCRYWSNVSTWFEIMSSPLVTYIFKTFPKDRATQFWKLLPQIWKNCNQRQLVSINFEKYWKNLIFCFFFPINHTFFVWKWILCEKCVFSKILRNHAPDFGCIAVLHQKLSLKKERSGGNVIFRPLNFGQILDNFDMKSFLISEISFLLLYLSHMPYWSTIGFISITETLRGRQDFV